MDREVNQTASIRKDENGIHQVKLEVEDAFTCCFNGGFVVHVYKSREGYVVDTFSKSGETMSTNCYFNEDIEEK